LPARVSSVTFGVSMRAASRLRAGPATGPAGVLGYGQPHAAVGCPPHTRRRHHEARRPRRPRRQAAARAVLAGERFRLRAPPAVRVTTAQLRRRRSSRWPMRLPRLRPAGRERLRVHAVGDHQRDERVPAVVERDPLETRVESGGGGIRTLGSGVAATTVFETAPFNHSGTPPRARHGRSRRVAAPAAGLRSGADRVGVPADDRRPPALAVDVDGDGEDALGRRRELLGELADAAHGLPRVIASATPSPCARAASIAWRSGSRSSCVVATTTAMRRAWASESDASAPISSATTFVRRPPPAARCC